MKRKGPRLCAFCGHPIDHNDPSDDMCADVIACWDRADAKRTEAKV